MTLDSPLNADCGEVDHAGEGGEHLDVADDLANWGGLGKDDYDDTHLVHEGFHVPGAV